MRSPVATDAGLTTPPTPDLRALVAALDRWLEDQHGASFDPYDGLTSPLFRPLRGKPALARVVLQAVKRSPWNLRPLLGIRRRVQAQSLSDLTSAYLLLYRIDADPRHRDAGLRCAGALHEHVLSGAPGSSWGMELPYASRFVVATPTTPNLFQTINAARALLDAWEVAADERHLDRALAVVRFLEHGLGPAEESSGHVVWRYYPGHDAVVYNVNALTGAFLARLAAATEREDLRRLAVRTLAGVLRGQNPDGSWFYARDARGHWVDGFHTGYVLEALLEFSQRSGEPAVQEALARGLRFFERHLLDPTGLPRYSSRCLYPVEVQNCAQAVQLLAKVEARDAVWPAHAVQTLDAVTRQLLVWGGPQAAPRAHFRLQRGRWLHTGLASVRWGQAPMLLALAWLLRAQQVAGARGNSH